MPTYALQRFDERKLTEVLAALKTARQHGEPGPLFPYGLELWRAESCAQGDATADDFRALFLCCMVGKPIDLLDRTPATLAGSQADADLRSALLGLELGIGMEPWMRAGHDDDAPAFEQILGLLRAGDVKRLTDRIQAIAPMAISVDEDELETYAASWDRFRRAFSVAGERGEGLALVAKG